MQMRNANFESAKKFFSCVHLSQRKREKELVGDYGERERGTKDETRESEWLDR